MARPQKPRRKGVVKAGRLRSLWKIQNIEVWSCGRKVAMKTQEEANEYADWRPDAGKPYYCHCGQWHLGHNKQIDGEGQ